MSYSPQELGFWPPTPWVLLSLDSRCHPNLELLQSQIFCFPRSAPPSDGLLPLVGEVNHAVPHDGCVVVQGTNPFSQLAPVTDANEIAGGSDDYLGSVDAGPNERAPRLFG